MVTYSLFIWIFRVVAVVPPHIVRIDYRTHPICIQPVSGPVQSRVPAYTSELHSSSHHPIAYHNPCVADRAYPHGS